MTRENATRLQRFSLFRSLPNRGVCRHVGLAA